MCDLSKCPKIVDKKVPDHAGSSGKEFVYQAVIIRQQINQVHMGSHIHYQVIDQQSTQCHNQKLDQLHTQGPLRAVCIRPYPVQRKRIDAARAVRNRVGCQSRKPEGKMQQAENHQVYTGSHCPN